MSTVILGLDPGGYTRPDKPSKGKRQPGTGFAWLGFGGEGVHLVNSGVLDKSPRELRLWIQADDYTLTSAIAISEVPQFRGRPTCHDAVKNQGVCEAFGGIPYNPSKIHSFFGTKDKKDIEVFVRRVLGDQLPAKVSDHLADAVAVALYHAAQIGVWQPRIQALPIFKRGGRRADRDSVRTQLSENPTQEELRELVQSGKVRFKF